MSYEERKKALFASLESAEQEISADSSLHQQEYSRDRGGLDHDDSANRRDQRPAHKSIRKFRGRESIFKRPALPINKCLPASRIPDFKKNPHKWTKYSLEDVDISDRSNTAAALSFLRDMESQKQDDALMAEETVGEGSTSFRGKVRFNRSLKLKSQLEEEEDPSTTEENRPKVKGTKVLMPEYVVGLKMKKAKTAKLGSASSKRDHSKELKLDHLLDEDGDVVD
ncbi:U5 small nuclear ribonucleoprotein TSSC4 [Topomyia yanbarensis]|uniref:U5 small nuclear ribonucleoprotein TSSC4 n=1 Tax=Topomyia yanbarensis TaxID=2498891 RepID=UPI00273B37D9|nr:U5 small nuclear ribonucleoprotein TSSC4 [Topomyia yanbarensis]